MLFGVRNLYGGLLSMKSLRTVRQEGRPAESSAGTPSCDTPAVASPAGEPRRDSRVSLPGPSAGWRLPSGQLLVEYALQTCFTGSPFDRSPFQADKAKEGELASQSGRETAAGEDQVSLGIHRLHAAVDREAHRSSPVAAKRVSAVRSDVSVPKPASAKGRPRT